jgi:hypothetical protein
VLQTEQPLDDFVTFVASANHMDGEQNNHHQGDGGIWNRRRNNTPLLLSNHNNDDLLMQPDLMRHAPTGIMFMFDRMLDCIDAPSEKIAQREEFHHEIICPASSKPSLLLEHTPRVLDDDYQSISTIDSLVQGRVATTSSFLSGFFAEDASPIASFTDTFQLAKVSPPMKGGDETLCLFPCWDDDDVIWEINAAKTKEASSKEGRPHGNSMTRRVSAVPNNLELVEKISNITGDTSLKESTTPQVIINSCIPLNTPQRPKLRFRSIYVSDGNWNVKADSFLQENNRKRNLNAMDDDGNGEEEVVDENDDGVDDDDDDDDDSLSKLLRGLEFDEPPFDATDERLKMDRTLATDCASSYSSLTY